MNGRTHPDRATHLTGDQLENLWLGESAPAVAAHLADCSLCRATSEAFPSTLAQFNQATLAWAEARGTRVHPPESRLLAAPRSGARRSLPAYAWAFAAAILLLAVMLFVHPGFKTHVETARAVQPDALLWPSASPDSQIAADNLLMADIDTALNQPDPTPFAVNLEQPALESATPAAGESAFPR